MPSNRCFSINSFFLLELERQRKEQEEREEQERAAAELAQRERLAEIEREAELARQAEGKRILAHFYYLNSNICLIFQIISEAAQEASHDETSEAEPSAAEDSQ